MAQRDADILRRIADRDRAAFETLYNECAGGVYAYLRSRGLDEATAADALQDTFLAAWNGAASYRGDARRLTWLIGIARHKLADAVRARERHRAAPLEGLDRGEDTLAGQAERLTLRAAMGDPVRPAEPGAETATARTAPPQPEAGTAWITLQVGGTAAPAAESDD